VYNNRYKYYERYYLFCFTRKLKRANYRLSNIISMNYCTYNDIHLNFKFKDQQVLKVILNRS